MQENLAKLRELTEALDFSDLIEQAGNFTELKVEEGTCFAWGLIKNEHVAASKVFTSKGTRFLEHKHEEHEHLLVYKGQMEITVSGEQHTLLPGNCLYIPPNTAHQAIDFPIDTWYLAVTIPASPHFPDGLEGS